MSYRECLVIYIDINCSFVARIEEIMSWVCMTELFRCILAISMVGYFVIMVHNTRCVLHLFIVWLIFFRF